ncbi:isochorismate synthase, partial [Vibrio genomosp. F10 str. 9ZC157]|uniref:isochorismate synthase n=1 Tax=Vibrio genomosp. F10 TaxID=723171 RepID=UPI00036BD921
MSSFHQAVCELIERVKCAKEGEVRLVQVLEENPNIAFIDWLEAQPIFPKFYWQSRDTREEVVALGQLYTFSDPAPAYAILGEDQRIWGGRSFDGNTEKNRRCMPSFFFLPQIELIRFDDSWALAVNITPDNNRTLTSLRKLQCDVVPLPSLSSHTNHIDHTPTEHEWQHLVDKVLDGIESGDFKKVVLARKTVLQLDKPVSAAQLLKASYNQNHHSFHFLMSLDQKHSFMGSTPERLYSRFDQELHTEALAGTIGRGVNATQDMQLANWLAQDEKNLNENQYVVDDIVERLTPHSEEIHVEQDARLIRLRKVQHLKRSIRAHLTKGTNGVQDRKSG